MISGVTFQVFSLYFKLQKEVKKAAIMENNKMKEYKMGGKAATELEQYVVFVSYPEQFTRGAVAARWTVQITINRRVHGVSGGTLRRKRGKMTPAKDNQAAIDAQPWRASRRSYPVTPCIMVARSMLWPGRGMAARKMGKAIFPDINHSSKLFVFALLLCLRGGSVSAEHSVQTHSLAARLWRAMGCRCLHTSRVDAATSFLHLLLVLVLPRLNFDSSSQSFLFGYAYNFFSVSPVEKLC